MELRVRFLAFTTDTVTRYALGKSNGLQFDIQRAKDWSATIRAIAAITPLVKQFPWLMDLVMCLPLTVLQVLSPELSRVVQLQYVCQMLGSMCCVED